LTIYPRESLKKKKVDACLAGKGCKAMVLGPAYLDKIGRYLSKSCKEVQQHQS